MGVSAFAQGQQGSVVGQGPLMNAPRAAAGADSADGAAAPADAAGGCVALWSLKNQFFPVSSFTTKAGVGGDKEKAPAVFTLGEARLKLSVCECVFAPILRCGLALEAVLTSLLMCHGVAGVMSLDFSQRNPHILGVGMQDGMIAVYDVRSRQETPVLVSTADTGKHADPVWKVGLPGWGCVQ